MASRNWELDVTHSDIHFSVRYLLISSVTGSFNIFSGTLYTPGHDDFTDASFYLHIDPYSINSNSTERDEHLKSADFLDADTYPDMEFRSTSFKQIDGDKHELAGNLTIKGVTKTVVLDVIFGGEAKDGFGVMRAGFEVSTVISRKDFGIHSDDVNEAGSLIVGEEIKLQANLQFRNIED